MRGQNFEKAAKLRDEQRKAQEELDSVRNSWNKSYKHANVVDEETIAEVVGSWTGIPVSRMMEEETVKKALEDLRHGETVSLPGKMAKLTALGTRFAPLGLVWKIRKWMKV